MATRQQVPRSSVLAVPPATPAEAARHFISRLQFETDPADVWSDIRAGAPGFVLVDARRPEAFSAAHLPGAVNMPHADIDERTTGPLDPALVYVTYCWGPACNASSRAAAALASLGLSVKELLGGLEAWQAEGFPVEAGPLTDQANSTQ